MSIYQKRQGGTLLERLPKDWIERTLITIVIGMIAFAAAAYGGVQAWSEVPLILCAVFLTGFSIAQIGQREAPRQARVPLVLLAVFGLLVAFQTLPLPAALVGVLSPHRLSTVHELFGEAAPKWLTLSYYSSATSHGLRLFLMGVAVFFAVVVSCADRQNLKRILLGVFGVGVAEALFAILQIFTGAPGIYWSDLVLGGVRSGSFVNHSNFAQFLNLTAGAGLGLLLIRLSMERHGKLSRYGSAGIDRLFKRHWWLFLGLAIHAVAIASSLSRGGILAMLIAGTAVAFLFGRSQGLGGRLWALVVLLPLVFSGLVLVGFDEFYDRLGTLEEREAYTDRWELGWDTLRVAVDHPLFGTGLETHAYVFPAYDTTGSVAQAEQADNDYAQLIEEVGLFGAVLVLFFLGWIVKITLHHLSHSQSPNRYACYGIAYGLIAVGIQSLTDFGQRVPAVYFVSALLCGVCVAITSRNGDGSSLFGQVSQWKSQRWLVASLAVVAIPLCGWSVRESLQDFRADNWWAHAYDLEQTVQQSKRSTDPQNYIDLVATAEMAAKLRPDNVEYAFWLNAYRWQWLQIGYGREGQSVAASTDGKKFAQRIADRLTEARRLCPTYGPAYTLEGQIRLVTGDNTGARLVRLGGKLTPNSPTALYAVAQLEAATEEPFEGRDEEVRRLLGRVVALDGSRFKDASQILIERLKRPEWAHELAGKNVRRLRVLAGLLNQEETQRELASELTNEANAIREDRVLRGIAPSGDIAAVAAQRAASGQHEAAVLFFRQALVLKYNHIGWRLQLSDVLVKLGRYEEAFREARTCMRIRPGHKGAKKRLEEISPLLPTSGITFQIARPSPEKSSSSATESERVESKAIYPAVIEDFDPAKSP